MDLLDCVDDSSLPQPPQSQRQWSDRQEAIFLAGQESSDNLLVEAVAGSGKTTTLQELTQRLGGSSLYLAFNKAIAQTARGKIQSADVKTMNALGHCLWLDNSSAKFEMRKWAF